jgi:hypothetical protein
MKISIILFLKITLGRLMIRFRSLVETRVISRAKQNQYENKNDCYYNSKNLSRDRPEATHELRVGLIIKPSQHSDKNNYYHSFKISNQVLTWSKT